MGAICMTKQEKIVLVDGNSLLYRAFYALPPMFSPDRIPTNAIYGLINMLMKIVDDEAPQGMVVAFDKGSSFRKTAYAEYKAQRQKTPEELVVQMPLAREAVVSLGLAVAELESFEGDDIIGTLARQCSDAGYHVRIVSGDRDVLQLIAPKVDAMLTRKGLSETVILDEAKMLEEYGIRPWQVVEQKGLMGDSSDNIPGVQKVGEKTALKLLGEYESIDGVYAHIEELKGKLKENLLLDKEKAYLSKELATINCYVPLDLPIEAMLYHGIAEDQARDFFQRMGFRSLLSRLGQENVSSSKSAKEINFMQLESTVDVQAFIDGFKEQEIALELYFPGNILLGAAIAVGADIFVCQKYHCPDGFDLLMQWLGGDFPGSLVMHRAKDAMHGMAADRYQYFRPVFDTELAAYLVNPMDNGYPLRQLSRDYLGQDWELEEKPPFATDDISRWLALRAKLVADLAEPLRKRLQEEELEDLFLFIEMPLLEILFHMELAGIKIDQNVLQKLGTEFGAKLTSLQTQIFAAAGEEFNINSTQQLGQILFEKLQLPALKKTKTGYSTDVTVLEQLAPFHALPALVLEHRTLAKLVGTYIEGLQRLLDRDGKIHTTFNQTITATGRLSSTEPNLQNIPIKMQEGRRIRKAFTATNQGRILLSADYSQIELRVLAHLSRDEAMCQAFMDGVDIHAQTASRLFKRPLDQIEPAMRSRAKTINFGVLYGMSDFRLHNELGIPLKEAQDFIRDYFAAFPGINNYIEEVKKFAQHHGYVTTALQRRRYIPEINSRNFNLRSNAERIALNTPVQGTAADIIKLAMVNLANRLKQQSDGEPRLLLQVHDELILEIERGSEVKWADIVREEMANAYELCVPLVVDLKTGFDWYEMMSYNSPRK
jgi:DNA polymerase-1